MTTPTDVEVEAFGTNIDQHAALTSPEVDMPDNPHGAHACALWDAPGAPVMNPANGATAGTPGAWTYNGATTNVTPPANLAATAGITASPATAWTSGQRVVCGDASNTHWDGAAWVAGVAP